MATLRQQLARELGIVLPAVHVCDNLDIGPGEYRFLVSGSPIARGACRAGRLLAIAPAGPAAPLDGEATRDPAFGSPAVWIAARDREMAEALGYAVVDHATLIATHLAEAIRVEAARMLGRQEVQHLLDVLAKANPKLVDDVVPSLLSIGDVLRVLRNLLRENVSIRDLRSILEALADGAAQTKDPEQLTELVRERLAPQITARMLGADGAAAVLTLDPRVEDVLRRSLREIAAGTGGALPPDMLRGIVDEASRAADKFGALSVAPALVTAPDVRRYARAIFERKLPRLLVASFREVESNVPLRVLATLGAADAMKEIRA